MPARRFDERSPCLVLAPHLEYPLRTGADILIDRRWSAFSRLVPFVDIVGRETVVRYRNGSRDGQWRFRNDRVPRSVAALKTVLKSGHYLHEKLLTREFREEARARAASEAYRTLVFSFIYTSTLWTDLPRADALACVETHNDEFKWFSDLRAHASNPLVKRVAAASEAWLLRHLEESSGSFVYLHVSPQDHAGYSERSLCPNSLLAPIGVELTDAERYARATSIDEASPLILTFAGALSLSMNRDALQAFAERHFPALRDAFGSRLVVRVVGSSPPPGVRRLCRRHGWELFPDVSDAELDRLLFETTFAILPFQYSTGLKVKLLVALSRGVPVLCTSAIAAQLPQLPPTCLVSDEPEGWVAHVSTVLKQRQIPSEDRRALLAIARSFSWDAIASGLRDALAAL